MKKIYTTTIRDGFYKLIGYDDEGAEVCIGAANQFFDLGKNVEFHVQTTKPRGDEYYRLEKWNRQYECDIWIFKDVRDESNCSPLMFVTDEFLIQQFPDQKILYVSAYSN